jgi:Cu2+-exporting ATPase
MPVVRKLQALGKRIEILSGDSELRVAAVASTLGIEEFRAKASPQDKLEHVANLVAAGRKVLVVGDGINDAPVMQAATVSLALGQGAALAQANADGVILGQSLSALPFAFELAARTVQVIQQNLRWAIAYNLCAVPAAAFGFLPPWAAALGMSLSSLFVVGNAARLARLGGQSRPIAANLTEVRA